MFSVMFFFCFNLLHCLSSFQSLHEQKCLRIDYMSAPCYSVVNKTNEQSPALKLLSTYDFRCCYPSPYMVPWMGKLNSSFAILVLDMSSEFNVLSALGFLHACLQLKVLPDQVPISEISGLPI